MLAQKILALSTRKGMRDICRWESGEGKLPFGCLVIEQVWQNTGLVHDPELED